MLNQAAPARILPRERQSLAPCSLCGHAEAFHGVEERALVFTPGPVSRIHYKLHSPDGKTQIRLPFPTRPAFFDLRQKSLPRGTILVLGSLALAIAWSGFPDLRSAPRQVLPAMLAVYGTWETARCLRMRWSFYHGGVLLLLYADVIAVAMILFLLLYPYTGWLL